MLFDIHRAWGYSAIVANFLAGLYTLGAWRWPKWRTRWLWWPTIIAEAMMMIQVFLGVLLVSMLNNLLNFSGVSSYYQWVLQGVIILIAVGLRDKGGES